MRGETALFALATKERQRLPLGEGGFPSVGDCDSVSEALAGTPASALATKERHPKGFPASSWSGESSAAGGFPAVGDWRTRRALGTAHKIGAFRYD